MTFDSQKERKTQSKSFHVSVVGGGLCGLACAVYLSRAGFKVDVFESASEFREIGAGLWLGPNALRALEEMGLKEAVIAHANRAVPALTPFNFVSAKDGHQNIHTYQLRPEDKTLGIQRASCLNALAGLLDTALIHFNKRCTLVSQENGSRPVIHFRDGTTFETDVVIGTDGLKSAVRQAVTGRNQGVVFTKVVTYRTLLPFSDVGRVGIRTNLADDPHCFVGTDKHIITYPIKGGEILNVVIFLTNYSPPNGSMEIPPEKWVTPASKEEILDNFLDCGPDVKKILSLTRPCNKWHIHAVDPPLSSYVRGHIALVGDSAHAMTPHLGSGIGQGLEDALILCRLLTHPNTNLCNIQEAFRAYDTVRLPRANMVLKRSAWAGTLYGSLPNNRDDTACFENLRSNLTALWEPVWHYNIQEDLSAAMDMLRGEEILW
ncbi:hypothetical protein J3A83DRAFT_4094105 [Scleroderma citrinum]